MKLNPSKSFGIISIFLSVIPLLFYPDQAQAQNWEISEIKIMPVDSNLDFQPVETPKTSQETNLESWQLSQHNHHTPSTSDPDDWGEPIHDSPTFWLIDIEQLEYRSNSGEDTLNWDIESWVGGDYQKLWIKTEGEIGLEESNGEAEVQILYNKMISPYWDLQAGLRYDQLYGSHGGPGRAFAVLGVQGLTPYLFEIDTALFISHEGDLSARFSAEQEFLLSQRLILQPKFEMNLAAQTVEEFGVGSGLNDIEIGLRLRYEFSRQFAPYIGINWSQKIGETADLTEEEGENSDNFSVVGGIKLFF